MIKSKTYQEKIYSMEYTREQMVMIHNIFRKEITILKLKLDKFMKESEYCQKICSEYNWTEKTTNIFGMMFFDRYMTEMGTALNMARKYNIHLEINNLDKTVINTSNGCLNNTDLMNTRLLNDFIEWKKTCFDRHVDIDDKIKACDGRIKNTEYISDFCDHGNSDIKSFDLIKSHESNIRSFNDKTSSITKEVDKVLYALLPIRNLDNFESGFEFEACIVYVRDYNKYEFFVCLSDDYKIFYELSRNGHSEFILHNILPSYDLFCVSEKNYSSEKEQLWRAVVVPAERHDESQKYIYLIDIGEVIPFTDQCKIYEAPISYKQIAPLAIKCVLEGVEDFASNTFTKDRDKCKRALQKNEFEKAVFRMMYKENRVLHVIMLEKSRNKESIPMVKNIEQTNPFLNAQYLENYEDNFSNTTAALQLPTSTSPVKEPALDISFEVGSKIQAIVTHVVSPISFYGIIQNDCSSDCKAFSWHDHEVDLSQKEMLRPPQLNDIVLSQFVKDGYWYRAKVINIDSERDLYEVFYVDFGNTEIVPLSCLAKCSREQLKDPLRAVRFHLSNLCIVSEKQNMDSSRETDLNSAIESIVVMILDQIINVEIVGRRNDDLVVRLIDSQYDIIPKMLIDMGVAKEV